MPQTVENSPITIETLVDIGKQIVRRLHPNFDPVVTISGDLDLKLSNALIMFTDTLYILFGNVVKHARLERPHVDIQIAHNAVGTLELVFISNCDDIDVHRRRIEEAGQKLASADSWKDISTEGETGFPKLAKIMSSSTIDPPVELGINENSKRFVYTLRFSFRPLKQATEGETYAHFGS